MAAAQKRHIGIDVGNPETIHAPFKPPQQSWMFVAAKVMPRTSPQKLQNLGQAGQKVFADFGMFLQMLRFQSIQSNI